MEEKKSSTLKATDKALIKMGICALILIAGILIGTQAIKPKTDELLKENAELALRLNKLMQAKNNEDKLKSELKKMESDTEYIFKMYPSSFTYEKVVEYIVGLWKTNRKYSFGISKIKFKDNGVFYTFVDDKGKENEALGKISSATVTVEYNSDYKTVKGLIDEINLNLQTKTSINELEIQVDKEVNALSGEVTFIVYYGYNLTEYEKPEFGVGIGKESIFN